MRDFLAPIAAAFLLVGCNTAPQYKVPNTPAPLAEYKETGPWTPARPADTASRGAWWDIVNDSELDALVHRLEQNPPRLAVAIARMDQSMAVARRTRSALFPQIDVTGGATRERVMDLTGEPVRRNAYNLGGAVSYELDLWGRVRNSVISGDAEAQASVYDLESVKLSLQAEVAENYLRLRGADSRIVLLRQTITAYQSALDLTHRLFVGGATTEADVSRASTQLGTAQSELEQQLAERALYEHAIAALLGEQPSAFAITPTKELPSPSPTPVSAPSELLQRRPDIAAAERRVAAANARIGVARAAYFPSITLGLSGGFASTTNNLISAGSKVWALGPAAALLPVFDGGSRKAEVKRSQGEFEQASAEYRQTVLDAFRNVEDQLTLTNRLANASDKQRGAAQAAARADEIIERQYRGGAVDYLQVVTAQIAHLQSQEALIDIETRRLIASIDLVRELGGDWKPPANDS